MVSSDMNISLGIVGLPNVGKSTLFNLLTKKQVPAENYPFNTIDPNVGVVAVMDERLDVLTEIVNPVKTLPAVVEFYDIAGLVRGASEGQGLGNQFLGHIREVAAIIHVVRQFENSDILHVENGVDMLRDAEIIHTELILKDIDTVNKRIQSLAKQARSDGDFAKAVEHLEGLLAHLDSGKLARAYELPQAGKADVAIKVRIELQLLTDKPMMFLINVEPENAGDAINKLTQIYPDSKVISMDVKLESELAELDTQDAKELMESYGLKESGIANLTKSAYELLNLISYFTAGEKEVRAWTIKRGENAPEAAGAIHTDFTKNYIAAEIVSFEDFAEFKGWQGARDAGKVRLEGKTYIVKDGDVALFRIGAG